MTRVLVTVTKKCTNHNLYYGNPNDFPLERYDFQYYYPRDPSNLPLHCSVIWLPVLPPTRLPNGTQSSELVKLLTAEYSIELNIDNDCIDCHWRGGQCLTNKHGFRCANAKVAGRRERTRNWILILCTVIPGAVFILIIGFYFSAWMVYRKYNKNGIGILINIIICFRSALALIKSIVWGKKTESYLNVETFLMNYGALTPKRYCYLVIKKMTNSFNHKLGQGDYGCVYKGMLNGIHVAVKVLNESKGNGEEFINEVASISRTSHVNVVTLLSFCFEGHKRALIYEFMPNGSLDKFINYGSSLTGRQLGWEKLHQVAVGIARGLEYLHRGCNTQILHFNIKPHNIVLDEDFCPKISDFGLARLCPKKESIISMLTARGTVGYIAPKVFCKNFGGVSHKSDVYSYGMMVLEMVGVRNSIKVEVDQTSEIYFLDWIYQQLEIGELGLRGIMNEEESERARKMVIVSLWCIQTDPSSRPSMTKVVETLEGSLESLTIPPKPFLSSPSGSQAVSASIEIT